MDLSSLGQRVVWGGGWRPRPEGSAEPWNKGVCDSDRSYPEVCMAGWACPLWGSGMFGEEGGGPTLRARLRRGTKGFVTVTGHKGQQSINRAAQGARRGLTSLSWTVAHSI